jgi:hypothetical protein
LTEDQREAYTEAFRQVLQQREKQLQSAWARTVYQP